MNAATVVVAVQLLVQAAQGNSVQVRAVCIDSIARELPCPTVPQFWLSKKVEPGPIFTAVPFKQHGATITFRRSDHHAVYNITAGVPSATIQQYDITYVDGRAWRFRY